MIFLEYSVEPHQEGCCLVRTVRSEQGDVLATECVAAFKNTTAAEDFASFLLTFTNEMRAGSEDVTVRVEPPRDAN